MENINIVINKATRQVNLTKSVIGNDGENLQEKLVFSFNDEFVDGTARLELVKQGTVASYVMLTKVGETYELPVQSVMTKAGRINMQLVITQGTNDEEIPVFKSNEFYVVVGSSIDALIEQDESYSEWIDVASEKLNELDAAISEVNNLDITASKSGTTTTITLTDKEGETSTVLILDGQQGPQGIQGIQGPQGPSGKDGKDGTNGTNGIDGKDGKDGKDGVDGQNGTNGQDGFSPIANVTQSNNVTTISITDKTGTTTASIDLSDVGGNVEVAKISKTSSSNYIVFNDLKPGIYDISSAQANNGSIYYKVYNTDVEVSSIGNTYNYMYCYELDLFYTIQDAVSYLNDNPSKNQYEIGKITHCTNTGQKRVTNISYKRDGTLAFSGISYTTYYLLSDEQTISGTKIFATIPKISSYSAPTQDTEFTPKKYVDDKIGDINTILATLTTPSSNN